MNQEKKTSPTIEHLKRQINELAYDMRDNRLDGWSKEHYRQCLKELRDQINKVLEK